MLHCKTQNAAMQTNLLLLASGILRLIPDHDGNCRIREMRTKMANSASIQFAPANGFFGRLVASIDRLLMSSARLAVRNGDLPYFGL
jgi:hypothetical protein